MKWLIINSYFPPEIGSASFLFFELGKKLVENGHDVTVLTGFPRYNVDVRKLPKKYRRALFLKESVEGMLVLRTNTIRLPRYVPVARGIDQFLTAFAFLLRGLFVKRSSCERILAYSPPLPLGLTAWALSRLKRVPFIFNVQDLFPQSAIDLGILKSKVLIRFFTRLERFIYHKADLVTVHSEGNKAHVLSFGVDSSKVVVVPNWIDTDLIKPSPRAVDYLKEFGLENRFVVSFAGVLGYSQDLDTVIASASVLKNEPITFLIVGDGVEKARLQQKVKEEKLENVVFLPMQPKDQYIRLLAASDACLVNLHKQVLTPVVPSKLLSIMAAGRSVVASLPLRGDAPKIIRESGCGICVDAGNFQGLADAIRKMFRDANFREECARKGRDYAEKNFSLQICVKIYEDLFDKQVS